jgi:hypothetical protein
MSDKYSTSRCRILHAIIRLSAIGYCGFNESPAPTLIASTGTEASLLARKSHIKAAVVAVPPQSIKESAKYMEDPTVALCEMHDDEPSRKSAGFADARQAG